MKKGREIVCPDAGGTRDVATKGLTFAAGGTGEAMEDKRGKSPARRRRLGSITAGRNRQVRRLSTAAACRRDVPLTYC
uniref:Uncharacterized protein n=1 Tax=Arundo donax TaxID=35708 RepID=A0A0A9DFV9_ARUDO